MAIGEKLKEISGNAKKLFSGAQKTVTTTTNKIVEDVKLKSNISDKKEDIEDIYMEIGKSVYASYKSGEDVGKEFNRKCNTIDKLNSELAELNSKILYNKDKRKCGKCGETIELDSEYCPNCGEKQDKIKVEEEEQKEEEPKDKKVCENCGAVHDPNVNFCSKCGTKL